MATIIDALVVELGLDAKDLEKKAPISISALKKLEDQGGKTEKSVNKISTTSKETAKSIESLASVVTGFLAVIGGTMAIKAFVADFISTNAQLDLFSKNIGLSVPTISAWSNAAEKFGGSAQGMQGTLDMLSKSQTQLMLTGESSLIPYLSHLGIAFADANGKARPVTDILLDLSSAFSHMDRTTANNFGRMMGIDQGTLNLLLQGRKELELEIQRQKEQTAVTKGQADAALKFQQQIVGIKQRFEALGNFMLEQAAPAIEKFFTILEKVGNWLLANKQTVEDFLKVVAVGLGLIAIATSPISLTVTAVVALAAAIALLWQDYQVWAAGGKSLFDWTAFSNGLKEAGNAAKFLGEHLKEAYEWFKKLMGAGHESDSNWIGIPENKNKGTTVDPITKQRIPVSQGPPPPRTAPISEQARYYAEQVSVKTGIPADIVFAQWQHETGGFTNRGATSLNNLAGINVPGGKGTDYRKFGSLSEFADYYSKLMSPTGRYSGAAGVNSADQFAMVLKAGGYYGDSEQNYANGMNRYLAQDRSSYAQSLAGIPGASAIAARAPEGSGSSQPANVDKSVKTDISTMNIYTQATDAEGMVHDINHAMDFLFPGQANTGLN